MPQMNNTNNEPSGNENREGDFSEMEVRLSESWDDFLAMLRSRFGNVQIESIREDGDCNEPSFKHSGKPGHINYGLVVSFKGQGLPEEKIDVITEWLHPLVISRKPTKEDVAWDTSLWPVENANKESAKIEHALAVNCRDAVYWVLFVKAL